MRSSGSRVSAPAVVFFGVSFCLLGQYAGPNINMVSATSDPYLQRQNEPSVAVSSRNSLHLVAGANDYRLVDAPGLPSWLENGDAWLGVFKSIDGGQTWTSTLLPGYPQDANKTAPLWGFQAAADPTVRSGSNGLFYYSGIAFNRGSKGLGQLFLARYIDNNNEAQNPDNLIQFLGVTTLASGTKGQFLDKPMMAVDIPRTGAGTCSIPGQSSPVLAGKVYVAYASFPGNPQSGGINAQIWVQTSTDCGGSFGPPVKLSAGSRTSQGAAVAIDPRPGPGGGTVYVVWRDFATSSQPDTISVAKSTDGGLTFSASTPIAVITPFDQGSSPTNFRTTAFPTIAIDNNGQIVVAWSQRGAGPSGAARIMVSTSSDGAAWSTPAVADPAFAAFNAQLPFPGHQIMPVLSNVGGTVMLMYYDLRDTYTYGQYTYGPDGTLSDNRVLAVPASPLDFNSIINPFISDATNPGVLGSPMLARRQTLDVRASQRISVMGFSPSVKVSKYVIGTTPYTDQNYPGVCNGTSPCQLQFHAPNLPLFALGSIPFIGDYIDLGAQTIVPDGAGGWQFNQTPPGAAVAHAVWTDNRDVRPPRDGDWTKYTPIKPAGPSLYDPTQTTYTCDPMKAGMRNQNIYTSRIMTGLVVGSAGNSKLLDSSLRAFPIIAQNATGTEKVFRFTITPPAAGTTATFVQFPVNPGDPPVLTTDASVAPNSGVARTVFASSTNPKTTILVTVSEIDSLGGTTVPGGLTGSVLLNADGTNPNVASLTAASISVSNPNISNPNISNPNISNPNISNPNISNPNISNVDVTNPNISNPNISNPNISNPNISNPNISNPNISNTAPTDATWSITNTGGTTTSASLKLFLNNNVPGGAAFQAVVYKAQSNPTITVTNTNDCLLGTESTIVPFVNITSSPDVFAAPQQLFLQPAQDPELSHMSVQVNPGETVYLTLRVYGTGGFDVGQFVNNSVTLGAVAQPDPPAKAVFSGPPVIATATLPDGTASTSYGPVPLSVFAGTAPLIWTASGLPPGVTIDSSTGVLQGSPTNLYTATYNPTITVTDSAVSPRSSSKTFQMTVLVPLAITTATLTDAGVGAAYSQPLAASGGIGSYSWSSTGMLPPGLDLSIGGVLSGNPTTADTYTIHAKVANSSAPMQTPATATLTLKVWPPIQIGTASLPDTGVNLSYNQSLVASGGTGSYSWTVTDGKLPDGLLLSTAGVLGGTPTTVGAYTFTVQATNASGPAQTGKQQYTVNVYAPIQVSGIALPPAGVGTFYTQTLSANGGHGPYTWSAAGSLPPGVSLSTQGVLSGTPTGAGNYAFSVTAANASGLAQSSSAPFSVTVYPVIHITTSALPATIIGSPYLVTLSANGGAGSYTWAVTGSLPPTLSLSPGGVLSGSVTAPGSFTFGVTASNASGPAQSASSQYTIYATAPLSFTAPSTTLPPATAGTPYSFTFVLNGVTGPVTWSSTTLPTGLTLSPAGTLSGTPAVSGAYQFDVTATDQFPQTVKQTFSINIAPMSSPTLVTTCVPGGTTATASSRTSAGDPNSAIDCVIANVPSQSAWNAGQHTGSLTLTLPSAMTLMGVTIDSNSTPAGQQSYAIYLDGSLTPIEPASTVFIPDTQCGSNQILFPAPITAKTVRVVTTNTNSWVSVCEVRLVATAGFTSAYQMQNWTPSASNGGTMTLSPSTGRSAFASFTYNVNTGAKNGVSDRNWSFQAPAAASGTVTFKYRYTGNHANANVTAYLKVSAGTSVTTLYNGSGNCGNTCTAPAGGFDVQGTGSITVTKGQIVKFTVGGSNKDGTLPALQGRVTITDLSAPQ